MVKNRKSKKRGTGSLLTRMNLRTIIHSKLQFIAVILITAIAMTLYVGLTSNAKSIDDRVNELYRGSNLADIWTTTAVGDPEDKAEIETLVGPNGEVEGRFMMPCKIKNYDATALISDALPTISKPYDTDNTEMDDFVIVDKEMINPDTNRLFFQNEDGSYTTAPLQFSVAGYQNVLETTTIFKDKDKDGNVIKTYSIMDAMKTCLTTDSDILTNPYLKMEVQVTGQMTYAENVQSAQMNNSNFIMSSHLFRSKLFDILLNNFADPQDIVVGEEDENFKTFLKDNSFITMAMVAIYQISLPNQYVAKVDPTYNVHEVKQNIQDYFDAKERSNLLMCVELDMLPSNFTIQNDITQARQLAYIFPIIFFLVAILVVLTTISQIIIKDRIQIGTMKALGLTKAQIIMHYMALGIYIVLIGVALGTIIGPFIIPQIMNQKYDILYTLPAMKYTLAVPEALISTAVVMAVTALVVYLIVKNTVRLKPAESMRPKEVKVAKAKKHDGKLTRAEIPIKMALRNIKLNFAKSLMVVIGIAGCTSLLVCGFGIDDTLHKGVDNDTTNFFKSDATVSYSVNSSLKDSLLSVDGVDLVEEYSHLPAQAYAKDTSYQTFLYLFEDNSFNFQIPGYEFKEDLVISQKVAKQMNLEVGDTLSFTSVGMTFEGKVGYILDAFYMHGIYVNESASNYKEIAHIKTGAYINFKEDVDQAKVLQDLNKVTGVTLARSRQDNMDMIAGYMSSISLMTLAVKVFAILLAIVVLYNLSLLNFKERSRDIATLKVLGFSKMEISSSLFLESMILTVVGVLIGLFFGLPMEILVLIVNLTPVVEFLYACYPMSYVISFLLTIGTTCVVNYALTFKIKGVKMVESLKSVE